LVFFAITIFIETAIFILGIIIFYKKNKQSIRLWKLDFSLALNFLKNAWPLALASLSAIIYMRIDQIMIGNMLGDKFLGNYSVAVNLSEIWYFVPTIIAGSVFPAILYSKKISQKLYLKRLQILYDSMFWIAFLIAVPVSFFSSQIISFLYGPAFSQASLVLSIYIWAGIAVFLGGANNKFLIAENLFSIFFYRSIIGMTVNIFLNLFFIPKYGIAGAGLATLISYFVVTFSVIFFKKSRESALFFINTLNIFRIIRMILNIKENYKTK
jgi:O-antigen/teichoic acid export membrane protein